MASYMSIDERIKDIASYNIPKTVTISNEAYELLLKSIEMAKELDMTLEEFLLKNMYINKK